MTSLDWQAYQERQQQVEMFVKHCMVAGRDYGSVIGDRPALLKPGAELLVQFFGLEVETSLHEKVMDWDGVSHKGEPLFYFRYYCKLSLNGKTAADGFGSANTWEPKHRYRWLKELPDEINSDLVTKREGAGKIFVWQYEKRTTEGKYGRPESYYAHIDEMLEQGKVEETSEQQPWNKEDAPCYKFPIVEYRVPNPEIGDLINTTEKMAIKRAFVDAALKATATSGYFTQDLDDMNLGGVKEWLPSFAEFYRTASPGLPNLLEGAESETDRINVIRSLFKDKFQIDTWDATLATQAQAYLLDLNKQKAVVDEDEAMEPQEGYGWLVHLAKKAGSKIGYGFPPSGSSSSAWRRAFDLLVNELKTEGVDVTPPLLIPPHLPTAEELIPRVAEVDVEAELREPDGGL